MKVTTLSGRIIETFKGEDNLYRATIDGEPANTEPAAYKGAAINRAVKACLEQEREQEIRQYKELGL